jgi:hypothetical protein
VSSAAARQRLHRQLAAAGIPRRGRHGEPCETERMINASGRKGSAALSVEDGATQVESARRTGPSPGARYTRAWRRRGKSGHILLRIEIDEAALAAMLVGHKLLDPLLADDRKSLTAATERALAALCEVSPHDREIVDTLRARLCLTAFQRTTGGAARASKPFARRTRAKNTG